MKKHETAPAPPPVSLPTKSVRNPPGRTSPSSRRMRMDMARPVRIPNAYDADSSVLDRTKLIAPFQKRPPSKVRPHIVLSSSAVRGVPQNSMLYSLIQSSIQPAGASNKVNRTMVAGSVVRNERKDREVEGPARGKTALRPFAGKASYGTNRRQLANRFFSRRGESLRRRAMNEERPGGREEHKSRLKERIGQFLYQPNETAKDEGVKRIHRYVIMKGNGPVRQIRLLLDPNKAKRLAPA